MRNPAILKNRNILCAAVMSALALGSLRPTSAYAQNKIVDGGAVETIDTPETVDNLIVGDTGTGTLTISNGGAVSDLTGNIGSEPGAIGTVTVTGEDASWTNAQNLTIGFDGNGTLTISDGATVSNISGLIGRGFDSTGTVTVTGAGSTWTSSENLFVGNQGEGTLTIADGGAVSDTNGVIGNGSTGTGAVTVTGPNSTWTSSGNLAVGLDGTGTLTIESGGAVNNAFGFIGQGTGSTGAVTVTGPDSIWTNSLDLRIGEFGTGTLTIESGGAVNNRVGFIGSQVGGTGTVTVTGAGSIWTNSGFLLVGDEGAGMLTIEIGGAVSNTIGSIGSNGSGAGTVTVTGAGSIWTNSSSLTVGNIGTGTLTIADGGTVNAGNRPVVIASESGSSGTLNIGAAAGDLAVAAGTLDAATLLFGDGTGTINFNHTDAGYAFDAAMTGTGTINQLAGVTTLTADNSGFTGATNITGGVLAVNDILGGTVTVSGGTLAGSGMLAGDMSVTDGTIAPGNGPDTLSIGGDLALTSGSTLDFELGSPSGTAGVHSDLLNVGGNLTLDGTLDITNKGGFGAGLYRLAIYGGTLTDNGLEIGTAPAGYGSVNLTLQTATAHQVNLLVGAAVVSFWDGADTSADGVVEGGDGIWSATGQNWTVADGNANGAFDPSVLVIFSGAAGTVTVDGSAGAIGLHSGMQFAADGYQVVGDAIDLTGANTIRVGDGTAAGAGFTATIASNLTGTGALDKTDLGTLVLTGTNSYSGGTTISAGTLVGNTTSLQGDIVDNAALIFDQASTGTYAGVISGTGSLTKEGAGTLTLSAANSYTGGTTISAGRLVGNTTSLQGDIVDNAALIFDQAGTGTYAGVISGTGSLIKQGEGTLILSAANSYSGGTTVSAGTLIGNTTSLQGDIVNQAALTFDQASKGAYAGALSGTGTLTKTGAGELVLTGDSSAYAGTTDITAGVLAVNGALGGAIHSSGGTLGGSGMLGDVTIAAGGTLAPGNSIGTLNVANATFDAGSTYAVQLDDGGFVAGTDNDLLNTSGTATIHGGTVQVTPENGADDGSTYTPGTYTILTAAGGVSGTFDTLTDDYAFLDFALGYDANHVFLTSSLASTGFCLTGMSANQCAVGNAAFSQGAGRGVFDTLLTLSNTEAPVALDQLSGEIHASTRTALLQDDRFAREAALGRLRNAQGSVDAEAGQVARETSGGATFWAQGFGAWSRWDGNRDVASMKRNVGGLLIGGDTRVADDVALGLMGGYSHASLHVDDRHSSATIDSRTFGAYAGDAWGAFSLKGGMVAGWHDIDTSRSIAFTGFADGLQASYKARTFQAYTEAAYGIESGKARVEPFVNVAYETLHTGSYRENGGVAALTADGQNTHATFSTLGLRAETPLALGANSARLTGSLGWRRAYGSTPTAIQRFASGGEAFTVDGIALGRNVLAVDAGFELDLTENARMRLSYNGQFGSGVSDQGARLGFNVAF